jgi:hypothetical protein
MSEEVFNAVVSSMSMYGGLIKSIIEEQGMKKALELHGKQAEHFGEGMASMFKQGLGGKEPDIKVLKESVLEPMMNSFGFTSEYEFGENSVDVKIPKCPMYTGYQLAGLSHETILKMCHTASRIEFGGLNKHYPTVFGSVKPRDSPEGVCIEKFYIKE